MGLLRRSSRSVAARLSRAKGEALEERMASLLRRQGWRSVRRNVWMKDGHGHWSEIDLVASGWLGKRYVECKNYAKPVGLEHVSKFKEVLRQNNIPLRKGLFVTTSRLTPRAKKTGLEVWDGKELVRQEKIARRSAILRPILLSSALLLLLTLYAPPFLVESIPSLKTTVAASPVLANALLLSTSARTALHSAAKDAATLVADAAKGLKKSIAEKLP